MAHLLSTSNTCEYGTGKRLSKIQTTADMKIMRETDNCIEDGRSRMDNEERFLQNSEK